MSVCACQRVCVGVPVCDDSVTLVSRADRRVWRQFFVGVAGNGKLSCNPGNIRLRTMAEVGNCFISTTCLPVSLNHFFLTISRI